MLDIELSSVGRGVNVHKLLINLRPVDDEVPLTSMVGPDDVHLTSIVYYDDDAHLTLFVSGVRTTDVIRRW